MEENHYDKLPTAIQEKIEDLAFKQLVLDTIKEAEQKYNCELCRSGIYSYKGERTVKGKYYNFSKNTNWDYDDIKQALPIIEVIFEKRKHVNTKELCSYSLKHIIEGYKYPPYLSNGDCIVAMLMSGYKMRVCKDINCDFDVMINKSIPKRFDVRNDLSKSNKTYLSILQQIYKEKYDDYLEHHA